MKHAYADRLAAMAQLPPHELLGVDPTSSKEDIRAAYLKLMNTYHPDRSDPFMYRYNQEVSKLVNVAYEKMRDTN